MPETVICGDSRLAGMKIKQIQMHQLLACVAGGIFGAQEVPKLYFACAYTIPPATRANQLYVVTIHY